VWYINTKCFKYGIDERDSKIRDGQIRNPDLRISGLMDLCDFSRRFKYSVFELSYYDASETAMPGW